MDNTILHPGLSVPPHTLLKLLVPTPDRISVVGVIPKPLSRVHPPFYLIHRRAKKGSGLFNLPLFDLAKGRHVVVGAKCKNKLCMLMILHVLPIEDVLTLHGEPDNTTQFFGEKRSCTGKNGTIAGVSMLHGKVEDGLPFNWHPDPHSGRYEV